MFQQASGRSGGSRADARRSGACMPGRRDTKQSHGSRTIQNGTRRATRPVGRASEPKPHPAMLRGRRPLRFSLRSCFSSFFDLFGSLPGCINRWLGVACCTRTVYATHFMAYGCTLYVAACCVASTCRLHQPAAMAKPGLPWAAGRHRRRVPSHSSRVTDTRSAAQYTLQRLGGYARVQGRAALVVAVPLRKAA
jgi:hypothetical protein